MTATRVVFFDVDYTLIHPGPMFQSAGYEWICARHGMTIDGARYEAAVASAACVLEVDDLTYDAELFIEYTRRIISGMGGSGGRLDACAREIYDAWARCEHFMLYEDVPAALAALRRRGVRVGLISNTHRCLNTFQQHFALDGGFVAAISSADHGFNKPHPSIFVRALEAAQVRPAEALMVGDSLPHDVYGARAVGMRALLVARPGRPVPPVQDVPVIGQLVELLDHL